jgi:hypothetical protein
MYRAKTTIQRRLSDCLNVVLVYIHNTIGYCQKKSFLFSSLSDFSLLNRLLSHIFLYLIMNSDYWAAEWTTLSECWISDSKLKLSDRIRKKNYQLPRFAIFMHNSCHTVQTVAISYILLICCFDQYASASVYSILFPSICYLSLFIFLCIPLILTLNFIN